MDPEKPFVERRKHKRYDAFSGVFAINSHFGLVMNISLGGLAFRYVDKGIWKEMSKTAGTLFGDDDLWIDNIPIRYITECTASEGSVCNTAIIKRRGVQFGDLNTVQRKLLETFIWIHTSGAGDATIRA